MDGPLLYSTLGSMKDVSTRVTLPSTLTYRERIYLKAKDPVEYKRQYEYVEGTEAIVSEPKGYDQCVTLKNCTEPPPGSWIVDPPINSLHPITLARFQKKWPLDFYAAIRSQTETTNEALRMLGTYACDVKFAKESRYTRPLKTSVRFA